MVNIAVYGSLRPGDYNYSRFLRAFGENDFSVLTTPTVINGYKMYSLGAYPGVKEASASDNIVVQVIACSNECYDTINNMEEQAGYTPKDITIEGTPCKLFIYNYGVSEGQLVTSGDWLQHIAKRQNKETKITLDKSIF